MTRIPSLRPLWVAIVACGLVVTVGSTAQAQQYYDTSAAGAQAPAPDTATAQDPGRVARLAYINGQVQFAPAGEDDWGSVDVNRPMVLGDRLQTGDNGLAVAELGDASLRIDNDSAFDFLNLTDDNVQVELSQGTLNLAVRQMDSGENFEVDTPTLAFVAGSPGVYRIDNDPDGSGSMVTVFRGSGTVYGANGASRQVSAGQSYRFNDSSLSDVDVNNLPSPDAFDRFCESRDDSYNRYAQSQQQYVPQDMIGGDQLYEYGQWNDVPEYGNVWYPRSVPSGWAPYRYGHWAWIDPWGWTWVDDQPWGFAPFHYGRWVYVRNRWGWMPGPVHVRPVYAPALVAFIGGGGFSVSLRLGGHGSGPVGWFPLGPRDVYTPWFHASRNYFTNVNVTNIRNVYVNKTVINNVYNDYRSNNYSNINRYNRYTYRQQANAVTAVPGNVFTGARPVHAAALHLDGRQLAGLQAVARPAVLPAKASLGVRQPTRPIIDARGRNPFVRPVVARHAPAPRPVSFTAREQVIASQHGQPVTPAQMQDLRRAHPAPAQRNDVRLVPSTVTRGQVRPVTPSAPAFHNNIHPIPARNQPPQPALRPGEVQGSRFAHPVEAMPRTNGARPAESAPPARLPVARPAERPSGEPAASAQQQLRAEQAQQRAAQLQDQQQRARTQQLQQQQAQMQAQREAQAQAQQRQREAQMQAQQQREAQMQAQREAQAQAQQRQREAQMQTQQQQRQQQMQQQREAQMQAQREAQMQAQQQQREQQMQQQREAQMQAQQQQREQQAQQRQIQMQQQRQAQYQGQQHEQPRREPPPSRKHANDSSDDDHQH